METLTAEHEKAIYDERWRAWEIKGQLHHAAFVRKVRIAGAAVVGVILISVLLLAALR